ncbi:hypothetical protein NON00_13670 [Roseomonas sp. GC11]|uniref:imm11 family protein n=1 Tax=Roseomonas sp. GC11 TaxID=2950546 RepID=UPI00210B644F|nr:DUF1629 domain-containing protein [Roseomonas sp. GC11]MCQ4160974.1 hypothetical protein [Roseomonas sp. GC11]
MSIRRDAYEALCQARDALDAGPPDGDEHSLLHRAYLKARLEQYRRAESRRPVIDPVPAMNRRFFTTSTMWDKAEFLTTPPREWYVSGRGRGWDEVRSLPKPQLRVGAGMSFHRIPPLLDTVVVRGTHILSRPLLEIWQRFDPEALDILPIALEGRRKQPVAQEYFFVDIVRRLPAFDLDAMEVFLFRLPKPHVDRFELFPAPQVFALREDMPVAGVHLFRDVNWGDAYFISAELRQACLDAGFTKLPLAHPETPEAVAKISDQYSTPGVGNS